MSLSPMALSSSSSSSSHGLRFTWLGLVWILSMLLLLLSSSVVLFVVQENSSSGNDNSHDSSSPHSSTITTRHDGHHHLQRRRGRGRGLQRRVLPQQQATVANATTTAKSNNTVAANDLPHGCLQSILAPGIGTRKRRRRRVCNSDDDATAATCRRSTTTADADDLHYTEMRMYAQPWESSIFAAWLLQIILSELLYVPTTIETGRASHGGLSLYDDVDEQNQAFQQFVANNNDDVKGSGLEKQALQHAIRYHQDCTKARRRGVDGTSSDSRESSENNSSTSTTTGAIVEYYEPCAHYIPEVWQPAPWMLQQEEGIMIQKDESSNTRLRLAPNGLVGQEGGWYIPKFTAQRDPTLLSYLGLQGEGNRPKMAETFLVPTTFSYYCNHIATTRCHNRTAYQHVPGILQDFEYDDPVAARPPSNEQEGARFFVPGGVYSGYFRRAPQNDCELHPTTCTGHLATYPCSQDTLPSAQLHHLDIALQGNGVLVDDDNGDDDDNNNNAGTTTTTTTRSSSMMAPGYSKSQLKELWLAANATKNNIIMTWSTPETSLFQEMLGTEAEMVRVALPLATKECLDHRVVERGGGLNQCAADIATRAAGTSPLGVCDNPVNPLQKLWLDDASSSSSLSSSKTGAAEASPAPYVLESFHLSNLQLNEIFEYWKRDQKKKKTNGGNNNDTTTSPRQAVCQWAIDNIQYLESFIPESYPRVIAQQQQSDDETDNPQHYSGLMYACMAVGSFAVLVIMITGFNVAEKKHQPVMQSAPLSFLYWILTGSLIVAVGGFVTGGLPPSNATCVAEMWLINIGFAIGFVPLIYKLAAIQHVANDVKRNRRVTPAWRGLAEAVILVSSIIMITLFLWTAYDPPRKTVAGYQLTGTLTEYGETIVDVQYYCSSEHAFWKYLQVAWNLLLLLTAAALAFVTAKVPQDFNERAILTALVHCHILFVLLWLISLLLSPIIDETTLTGFRSMVFSLDAMLTMAIYVFPKFVVRDPERPASLLDNDSEVPTSAQPPLGPIARCIACISGVSSGHGHEYQHVDSDDPAFESKLKHAPAEAAPDNVEMPRRNDSNSINNDEILVSHLRASVQELEEERQELRSEVEKKNMAISMLEEEVGSLMEKLMGSNESNESDAQNTTTEEMRAAARELQQEEQDLRSFLQTQDSSMAQLMSDEAKLLQKLGSRRYLADVAESGPDEKEPMWDAVWRWDKENDINRLYTWETTDESMETGEI